MISVQEQRLLLGEALGSDVLCITHLLQKLLINEYGFPPKSLSVSAVFHFRFILVTKTIRAEQGHVFNNNIFYILKS